MSRRVRVSLLAAVFVAACMSAAFAQTGMIKGKVVDPDGKPLQGVAVTIEFNDGITRKYAAKTDRRGEFIQIGLPSGNYKVTATHEKLGSQSYDTRVRVGQAAEVNFALTPGAGAVDPKAAELKKLFEEGVAASRANDHDNAIAKFQAAAAAAPTCHDCYYNIGVAYMQKKDLAQAEASWLKAIEVKPDYSEAMNALSTLYNNQKRFDEASAMSAKAATAGGATGGGADAVYNQGIILWNQGKIAEAKLKFEEALKSNPDHAESHFQLGMALLNEGKTAEAVGSFETYLKLAPTGQFSEQSKQLVAQLKK
ncbi:MAG: tetratricopeptide repeat protein [Vicinamibacterales bacterium]